MHMQTQTRLIDNCWGGIRGILRENYSQEPQLSSSCKIARPITVLMSIAYRDLPWIGIDMMPLL